VVGTTAFIARVGCRTMTVGVLWYGTSVPSLACYFVPAVLVQKCLGWKVGLLVPKREVTLLRSKTSPRTCAYKPAPALRRAYL
jgi:hypothetical protein